jgi:hypothetical protein
LGGLRSIAQFAAAAATIGLAGVTTYMAIKIRQVAEATSSESGATVSLAQESKIDRELAWRPQLSLVDLHAEGEPGFQISQVRVKDAGGGPAIKCKVAIHQPQIWWLTPVGDLQVNSEVSGVGDPQPGICPDKVFKYVFHGVGGLSLPLAPELVILALTFWVANFGFPSSMLSSTRAIETTFVQKSPPVKCQRQRGLPSRLCFGR